jgi:hypothetical protein
VVKLLERWQREGTLEPKPVGVRTFDAVQRRAAS